MIDVDEVGGERERRPNCLYENEKRDAVDMEVRKENERAHLSASQLELPLSDDVSFKPFSDLHSLRLIVPSCMPSDILGG